MLNPEPIHSVLPTVSAAFIHDWLEALRCIATEEQVVRLTADSGLTSGVPKRQGRVTRDQIVHLYKAVVAETGDEMMGLWSRPIRIGALKVLCASVLGASSIGAALNRFTIFWNLLLDDHYLTLSENDTKLVLDIFPDNRAEISRFGHMLMLKLAHGMASWLALRELPLTGVGFAFKRPTFAEDYPVLFPGPVRFEQATSWIGFDKSIAAVPVSRSEKDMAEFLHRAPRDWIFTDYREHALPLRIRELLALSPEIGLTLAGCAERLNVTPRTLIRQLKVEQTSFQSIKDGVRRDLALRDLAAGHSIEAVAQDAGFASAASFHRAFRGWMGMTPGQFRDQLG